MQCIIITRFDVATPGVRRHGLPIEEYSRQRLPVMMKTLYPSLMNQTDLDFTWLILTGSDSQFDITHLEQKTMPHIAVVSCAPKEGIGRARRAAAAKVYEGHRLVTIRIDSDDLVHREHIARMKALGEQHLDGTALVFTRGYTLDLASGKVYEYPHDRLEKWPLGLFGYVDDHPGPDPYGLGKHTQIFDEHPYHKEPFYGWMRTVNGTNLSESAMHFMDTEPVDVDLSEFGVTL